MVYPLVHFFPSSLHFSHITLHSSASSSPPSSTLLLLPSSLQQPEEVSQFEWGDPEKLLSAHRMDLSQSMDSSHLKVFAEQLSLMEFSVYAAIQRR